MEKVTSLKKEKGTRSFTKLKINANERMDKTIDKIVKFIYKDLTDNEVDLSNFNEYLIFNNFTLSEVEVLPKDESNKIRNTFYKKDTKNFYQAYDLAIEDRELNYLNVFTNTVDISSRAREHIWRMSNINHSRSSQRICDVKYLYGMLKLLDITYEHCMFYKEIYNESFSEFSIYGNNYAKEDVINIVNLEKVIGVSSTFRLTQRMMQLIIDVILIKQSSDYNIELMEQYSRDIHSEVARAFETKKNIPQKIINVMNNNKFLENFSYVELDSDTDLNKFKLVEKEFLRIRKLFDMDKIKKAELRIRKLGKHKALGLYYPTLKCLCVDITSPSSFMHEFGHHLDYTLSDRPLSLQYDFRSILRAYTKRYDSHLECNPYLNRKRNYFLTPTEIFARTFEIYLVNKGLSTSFLKDKDDMDISNGYPGMDEEFISSINSYFDRFNFNFFELNKEEAIKNEIKETMNIIIEEIKYSATKQVSFF
ncbi:hypothetical protein GKZ28_08070 [Clostridium chromiireducens]|jgi:hypothetical protein|uniref:Large polyvalent protein-associated domain-containing protein n=1 Tax=Clostridium chromiireducens TaxID=225345 RepID=A0A964RLB2_9CLOT|nr:hypothetical protein [Clostridium chromiireducens]MVX63650.1 hypothetical protein [Clostridium chromiireducens]